MAANAYVRAVASDVRTVLGPRYLVENIGETINWRRVCVRNERDRLHPGFLRWPLQGPEEN